MVNLLFNSTILRLIFILKIIPTTLYCKFIIYSIINFMDKNIQDIIGYNDIEKNLWQNFLNGKLHHCNLISGEKGNGKASFIKEFAKKITSHGQTTEQNINNHPDILIVSGKSNKKNGQEKILIDDIREIKNFTNLSGSISKNKVIVIDAIDDANKNAYNALLKTIEEPNKNIFIFIINHNIKNIPDTVKSRSNIIKRKNFNFKSWLEIIKNQLHNASEEDLKNLYLISPNSIGESITLHENKWLDMYKNLILSLTSSKELEIINFSEIISSSEVNFNIFKKIIFFVFLRITKIIFFEKIDLISSEERLLHDGNFNMERIFFTQDKINIFLSESKLFNLDQRYSVLNIILLIKSNFNNHVNH